MLGINRAMSRDNSFSAVFTLPHLQRLPQLNGGKHWDAVSEHMNCHWDNSNISKQSGTLWDMINTPDLRCMLSVCVRIMTRPLRTTSNPGTFYITQCFYKNTGFCTSLHKHTADKTVLTDLLNTLPLPALQSQRVHESDQRTDRRLTLHTVRWKLSLSTCTQNSTVKNTCFISTPNSVQHKEAWPQMIQDRTES